jgi:hypothetical protein
MHKKTKNSFTIKGKVTAILRDAKTGKIKQIDISKNIIVNVGLTAILNRLGINYVIISLGVTLVFILKGMNHSISDLSKKLDEKENVKKDEPLKTKND